jgi:hypothetical protein
MSRYFCWVRFIELIKERYPKINQLIIWFDPRKDIEKTKYNQLSLYPYRIVIVANEKKYALNYSKFIEICGRETGDDNTSDTYEIIITLIEGKNKSLNINKKFQLFDASTDIKKFITKDKKTIEYFPSQIINNVKSNLFNDMINKKKKISE